MRRWVAGLQCMQASPYSVELDQFYHQAETEVLPHTACLIMYNACRARIHLLHPVIRDPCINLPALYPAAAVVQLWPYVVGADSWCIMQASPYSAPVMSESWPGRWSIPSFLHLNLRISLSSERVSTSRGILAAQTYKHSALEKLISVIDWSCRPSAPQSSPSGLCHHNWPSMHHGDGDVNSWEGWQYVHFVRVPC